LKKELLAEFDRIFHINGSEKVYFAPGRVNLIGEHTDYNGGHVFPSALTIGTYAVTRKREDDTINFYSMNFSDLGIIKSSINGIEYKKEDNWTNYPKGIIWALEKKGYTIDKGLDILFYGNIPNGSGLSSSASIEVLMGFLCRDLFDLSLTNTELAIIGQYSENKFNGVNCGIMDQFAIAMGKKDNAIFLDTSDLSFEYAPLNLKGYKILIMNTNKKRGLADSKYNERRSECEKAVELLNKKLNIKTLGELSEEEFEENKYLIEDSIIQKRAKHAVYENQRTIKAVKALNMGDIIEFADLINKSGDSLRYDYEVTGIELDTIVDAAREQEGIICSRMTGAGFGGCALSIIKEDSIDKAVENIKKIYKEKIGYDAECYIVDIGMGPVEL